MARFSNTNIFGRRTPSALDTLAMVEDRIRKSDRDVFGEDKPNEITYGRFNIFGEPGDSDVGSRSHLGPSVDPTTGRMESVANLDPDYGLTRNANLDPLDIGGTFTDTPTDTNVGGVGELDTPDQSHPDQQETRATDASRGRDPRATDRKMEDLDLDGNNYRAWAQGAALAMEGLTDIVNARMRADRAAHQARINISIAQRRANTAITQSLTRSARLKRKGQHDAEKLKAYMAAQGQNVTGDFVQQAAAAHEMQGINEGMIEEINGIRNALGFKEQIIVQEMTAASAKIQRDLDTIMGVQKIGAGTILIAGS